MLYVLGAGRRSQIGLAVIETIMVNMIDEHSIGHFAYLAVHVVPASFARSVNPMSRVERRAAFGGEPFALGEPKTIVRIDDGLLALGKRGTAERIAVSNAPIEKDRLNDDPNEPGWDGDGKLKDTPSAV